jgi:hypothetical protein
VIDPVWNETLPTSYIFNRDGEVVKKVQGKKPIAFFRRAASRCGPLILCVDTNSGATSARQMTRVEAQVVLYK